MTPQEAKLKQKADARRRSMGATRQTSSNSTMNSQVTEEPPQVYQVPQINVPEDLHGVAKLIQTELSKIAQSQSIILTLWERIKGQSMIATAADGVAFGLDPKSLLTPSPNGAGVELVWSSDQTVSAVDFHSDMGSDYDARISCTKSGENPTGAAAQANLKFEAALVDINSGILQFNGTPTFGTGWASADVQALDAVSWNAPSGLYREWDASGGSTDMIVHLYGGGEDSCPAMQLRANYKNGGLSYRSARDNLGFELDFVELATVPAMQELKQEIYTELVRAGVQLPDELFKR